MTETKDDINSITTASITASATGAAAAKHSCGRGTEQEEKRSHQGVTIRFRVFPEEAEQLKARAADASMTVSEFCRRATAGKRIIARYDYDVIRRLAEVHGDQTRLGNLFKAALNSGEPRFDKLSLTALMLKLSDNQDTIKRILMEAKG